MQPTHVDRARPRGQSTLRESCPLVEAVTYTRLSADDAVGAPFDQRLASIWRYLIRRVRQFQDNLRPRERAHFDFEDTLLDLWIELAEADAEWDHRRGTYITFAGRVVRNKLIDLYEHARVVQAPRNAYSRYRDFALSEATLSPAGRALLRKLAGVIAPQESLPQSAEWAHASPPAEEASTGGETRARAGAAVLAGLAVLEPLEVAVMTCLWGLGPAPAPLSPAGTAALVGLSVPRVRQVEAGAMRKMHAVLLTRDAARERIGERPVAQAV